MLSFPSFSPSNIVVIERAAEILPAGIIMFKSPEILKSTAGVAVPARFMTAETSS